MKKHESFTLLTALLFGLASLLGCLSNGGSSSSDRVSNALPAYDQPVSTEHSATVIFQIVLPSGQKTSVPSAVSPSEAKNPAGTCLIEPSSAMQMQENAVFATATFRLALVNFGNSANPVTTLSRVVSVSPDGTAVATFSGLTVTTAIGGVRIDGGRIGSFSDFRGALDLQASETNRLQLFPRNATSAEDVVAATLERIVASPSLFLLAQAGLASRTRSFISGLDLSSASIYEDAVRAFIKGATASGTGDASHTLRVYVCGESIERRNRWVEPPFNANGTLNRRGGGDALNDNEEYG
ncbi:MAG: hypothetical protein WA705_30000 [Candidatus Ozemobacteraceae bacterium]